MRAMPWMRATTVRQPPKRRPCVRGARRSQVQGGEGRRVLGVVEVRVEGERK